LELQFVVELQDGKLLTWGPLLSTNMGYLILGDLEEITQKQTVCFNIVIHSPHRV